MNDISREKLIEAIKLKGQAVMNDPRLCEALLTDLCGGASRRHIKALSAAVATKVVADLSNTSSVLPMEARITQYAKRLYDDFGFDEELACWAVESWAQALGVWNDEYVLRLALGVTIELVRIPAGEFLMGCADYRGDPFNNAYPQHKLILDEYLIGKYPVTNTQYSVFVKATGYQTTAEKDGVGHFGEGWEKFVKGSSWQHPRGPNSTLSGKNNHPVTLVSWDDAMAFCAWVNQLTGRNVKLPSEAEWEKAARGTDGRIYPWGNQEPDATRMNKTDSDTTPVGKYIPAGDSPYGVADMAELNCQQWTSSLWGNNSRIPSYGYPYNPDDGREDCSRRDARVLRGGGYCSTFIRHCCNPFDSYSYYGFRVAVSQQPVQCLTTRIPIPVVDECLLKPVAGVAIEMMRIPAGEFLMGDDNYETYQHKMYLDTFLIGKYPVTNAQFSEFSKANNRTFTFRYDKENHPAGVSWDDAVAFCTWVSQATGSKVRLPTEAQWEKAARGADWRIFPWGNSEPDASKLNYNNNVRDTTPVGRYSPAGDSPYGVADMAGNLEQWTSSREEYNYDRDRVCYGYPYNRYDEREDMSKRGERVIRGCNWSNDYVDFIRSSFRQYYQQYLIYGFRVAVLPT